MSFEKCYQIRDQQERDDEPCDLTAVSPLADNTRATANARLIEAAEYAASILAKIPAFGDSIGTKVSKPQIGIALNKLMVALTRLEKAGGK